MLQNNELQYFTDDKKTALRGTVPLERALSIHPSAESHHFGEGVLWNRGGGYFQIDTDYQRQYYLCADSAHNMQQWVDFLNYSKTLYAEKKQYQESSVLPPGLLSYFVSPLLTPNRVLAICSPNDTPSRHKKKSFPLIPVFSGHLWRLHHICKPR